MKDFYFCWTHEFQGSLNSILWNMTYDSGWKSCKRLKWRNLISIELRNELLSKPVVCFGSLCLFLKHRGAPSEIHDDTWANKSHKQILEKIF